jgi:hypothetical protein
MVLIYCEYCDNDLCDYRSWGGSCEIDDEHFSDWFDDDY